MKTFKDTAGRTWSLHINVDAIKRVRGLTTVNLLDALEGKLIERLSSDPILLCDVLYALIKPDADALKISDEDFGRAIGGDALDHATTALLDELVDFFPARRRHVLTKTLNKLKDVETKALSLAEKRLESVDVDSILRNASASSGA